MGEWFDGNIARTVKSWIKKRFRITQPIFNGLTDASKYTFSYSAATRQATITNAGTDVVVSGTRVTPADETTAAHADTTSSYFFWYDEGATTLTVSTSAFDILTDAPIGFVYYNTDQGAAKAIDLYEQHEIAWDADHHYTDHFFHGTKYISGLVAADYILQDDTNDASIAFSIATGVVADEDIVWPATALPAAGPYTIFYRAGADAANRWDWDSTPTVPLLDGGSYLYYNLLSGGNWTTPPATNGTFVNMWEITVLNNGDAQDVFLVMGQALHTKLIDAQAATPQNDIDWGDNIPFTEFTFNRRWTFRTGAGYGTTGLARIEAIEDLRGIYKGGVAVTGAATDHNTLSNRDATGSHPTSAIEVDASGYAPGGTLSTVNTTPQSAFDTLYSHSHSGLTIAANTLSAVAGMLTINTHVQVAAAQALDCATNGAYLKPRRLSQSAQPTPDTGELLIWRDSDDNKTYMVYEDADGGTRKVEMT